MLERLRIPGLGGWADDPLWASVYDWTVEHPVVGGAVWRVGLGSDLGLLHAATSQIGRLPAGASVLDVPCGGGVALRGVRRGQGLRYVAVDIAEPMLERTLDAARERQVGGQVEVLRADVVDLPHDDGEFDLVVSLTGLHCFPDPRAAVLELGRVTRSGGAITGSAVVNDSGLRHLGLRVGGRFSGLLGPGGSRAEITGWLEEAGFTEVDLHLSGAVCYFHALRA